MSKLRGIDALKALADWNKNETKELTLSLDGKDVCFTMKKLTDAENMAAIDAITKDGASSKDIDKANIRVILAGISEPCFSGTEFLNEMGCADGEEAVMRLLPVGLRAKLTDKILEFSGAHGGVFEEALTEAKN